MITRRSTFYCVLQIFSIELQGGGVGGWGLCSLHLGSSQNTVLRGHQFFNGAPVVTNMQRIFWAILMNTPMQHCHFMPQLWLTDSKVATFTMARSTMGYAIDDVNINLKPKFDVHSQSLQKSHDREWETDICVCKLGRHRCQTMTCCLFGSKPSSEHMLDYR